MRFSWFFVLFLLALVAVFSVQNAAVMTVHFLSWNFTLSAALVIQIAAMCGGVVGLLVGAFSRRPRRPKPQAAPSAPPPRDSGETAPPDEPGHTDLSR